MVKLKGLISSSNIKGQMQAVVNVIPTDEFIEKNYVETFSSDALKYTLDTSALWNTDGKKCSYRSGVFINETYINYDNYDQLLITNFGALQGIPEDVNISFSQDANTKTFITPDYTKIILFIGGYYVLYSKVIIFNINNPADLTQGATYHSHYNFENVVNLFYISPTGHKLIVGNGLTLYEYNFSTNYDANTLSLLRTKTITYGFLTNPSMQSIFFSDNGDALYYFGFMGNSSTGGQINRVGIYRIPLSSAWDISTIPIIYGLEYSPLIVENEYNPIREVLWFNDLKDIVLYKVNDLINYYDNYTASYKQYKLQNVLNFSNTEFYYYYEEYASFCPAITLDYFFSFFNNYLDDETVPGFLFIPHSERRKVKSNSFVTNPTKKYNYATIMAQGLNIDDVTFKINNVDLTTSGSSTSVVSNNINPNEYYLNWSATIPEDSEITRLQITYEKE